jgi:hypothetical protein
VTLHGQRCSESLEGGVDSARERSRRAPLRGEGRRARALPLPLLLQQLLLPLQLQQQLLLPLQLQQQLLPLQLQQLLLPPPPLLLQQQLPGPLRARSIRLIVHTSR